MENPIKMDDLGVPLFLETPIYIYIYSTYHFLGRNLHRTYSCNQDMLPPPSSPLQLHQKAICARVQTPIISI